MATYNGITIDKIKRSNVLDYLNTTPSETTTAWSMVGCGITELAYDYSADKESERWITEDVNRQNINGYEVSGSVSQTCYKGDPVFEYINNIRRAEDIDNLCYTQLLEVEKLYSTTSQSITSYTAYKHEVIIEITKWLGEKTAIEYTINFNGPAVAGTVTYADGVPTFTPSA